MEQPADNPSLDEIELWVRAAARQIRACAKNNIYGTLRFEFFNGRITRSLIEKSVKDPSTLAPGFESSVD